ncbi:MAG: putative manganese-dependent inorganic diphosphatase [Lentisphaerae bacterium]|nr:putative manganese-dependent inorganic diphosphatase [Lentisphaerota bacterium]
MNRRKVHQHHTLQTFISGHRNPDIDSLAAAAGLAVLRGRHGEGEFIPLCPGVLPDRAKYLFDRFQIPYPVSRNDVYIKIADLMSDVPLVGGDMPLFSAVEKLRETRLARLPVTDENGRYLGMLSGLALLSKLLSVGGDGDGGDGLTGRKVYSSAALIKEVLEAELLTGENLAAGQDFEVYVAAMSAATFKKHLPSCSEKLAVIVGDRPDIQQLVVERNIRLMIVTGNRPVSDEVLAKARENKVVLLLTGLDSAAAIRRLKFSVPVKFAVKRDDEELIVSPADRLRDVKRKILDHYEDVIPAVDNDGILKGVILKHTLHQQPPYRMILVDHNEIDQSPPGVEEIPVVEVVDHHRIGMMPTAVPIRFTGDVVGSSCTLVAMMYRSAGERLTPEMAGLLLGGIISDTLLLKSPTTADLDRRMCDWLEKLSGVGRKELMDELLQIDSPLAVKPALEVINGDRKDYTDRNIRFALSQVEESNLELLHQRRSELTEAMYKIMETEKLDFFGLLVTDAVRGNSELLALGDRAMRRSLPYRSDDDEIFLLPGVLSRKKQLLPQMLSITSTLQDK